MAALRIFTGGELWAKASRWPWQRGAHVKAPLNTRGSRFGGGWDFALGFRFGWPGEHGFSVLFELGVGLIRVGYRSRAAVERNTASKRRAEEALRHAMGAR